MADEKWVLCFFAGSVIQQLKGRWPLSNETISTVVLKQMILPVAHAGGYARFQCAAFAQLH